MKIKLLLSALAVALGGTIAASHLASNELCEGFLPKNDLKIPVGSSIHGITDAGGLDEATYNKIMDKIEKIYSPIVASKGGTLKVNRLWSDATVNSSANRTGNTWEINMYGGLARHPDITYEGEALVACHELGHHLGGAPKSNIMFGMMKWATNEGGADYFASLKCLRRFFADEDNISIVQSRNIDATARNSCQNQFTDRAEEALCERISLSGQSVAYVFQALRKEANPPKFDTPDTSEVTKTNDDHPATQCRMDTYFAGDLCTAKLASEQSDSDFKVGACVQGVDKLGYRPRCWFNPASTESGSACPLGSEALCSMACKYSASLPFCKSKSEVLL